MKIRTYIQIFVFVGLIILLYSFGVPLQSVILIGIFMLLLLAFKTKVYKKIDKTIREKLRFNPKFPEWAMRLIIIVIFLLIYLAVREIVFLIIKALGFDIQKIMFDGINRSMANN